MLSYKGGKINLNCDLKGTETDRNFTFSANTTYGVGGRAKIAYFPKNLIEARAVYDKIISDGEKFTVVGNGSNLLASERFYDGAVISTKRLKGIVRVNGERIFCLAGTPVGALLKYCLKNNCGGLEYLCGIPATVGGLAYMNGGAGGKYLSDNIYKVYLYDGKNVIIDNKECNFAYKYSTMRDINAMILGVWLNFESKSADKILSGYEYYSKRRSHLPKGRSCGCVFKNPCGFSAGKLIEECGLKGLKFGGAEVSRLHANFIINDGGCADDIKRLISAVRRKVYERTGVLLEEEVVYIGEFNDFDS